MEDKTVQRYRWSKEETDILRIVMIKYGNKYTREKGDSIERDYNTKIHTCNSITEKNYRDRSKKQIREHWDQVANPSLNKSPLTEEEKAKIASMPEETQKNWTEVAAALGTNRPGMYIMNEYHRSHQNTKDNAVKSSNDIIDTGDIVVELLDNPDDTQDDIQNDNPSNEAAMMKLLKIMEQMEELKKILEK